MTIETNNGLYLSREDKLTEGLVRYDDTYKIIFNEFQHNFYQIENSDVSFGEEKIITLQPSTKHKQIKVSKRKQLLAIHASYVKDIEQDLNLKMSYFDMPIKRDASMIQVFKKIERIMNTIQSNQIKAQYFDAMITELIIHKACFSVDQNEVLINKEKKMIENYVQKNYREKLTLNQMANDLSYSKYYLIRLFKQYFDMTPIEYINYIRINKALNIINKNGVLLTEIAYSVGYNSYQQFSKWFKFFTFITPNEYVKKYS